MNKTTIIISVIIIVLVAGFVAFSYSQSTPAATNEMETSQNQSNQKSLAEGPKIQVSPASYDFGTVIYGDVPEYNFTITNIGDEPLKILRLSTSCGCTEASMAESDKIIAPGKSVPMLVTFNPAVHEDDSDLGALTRIVYIKSNDSNNPELEVTINAFVIKK